MTDSKQSIISPETPVLIVDDNPQYTLVLKKMLQAAFGYQNITSVESTEEAFDLLKAEPDRFRLLFVDYMFPSGDGGGALLRKLNQDSLLQGKVAFLITSEPTIDNMKEALSAGAQGVVAKPFDREGLRRQIEKAERAMQVKESF